MPTLTPRGRLIRDAVIYTPPFIFFLVMIALMIAGVFGGIALFGLIILVGLAFLFGYQSIQSIRDLLTQPRDIVGPIRRRWTKRDGFVVKNYYISVEKAIFHIAVDDYMTLKVGDIARVHAYPHTGTIVSVTKEGESEPQPEMRPAADPRPKGRARTLRTARATPRERREPPAEDADHD